MANNSSGSEPGGAGDVTWALRELAHRRRVTRREWLAEGVGRHLMVNIHGEVRVGFDSATVIGNCWRVQVPDLATHDWIPFLTIAEAFPSDLPSSDAIEKAVDPSDKLIRGFDWALFQLRAGARVGRRAPAWGAKYLSLTIVEAFDGYTRIRVATQSQVETWIPGADDLLALDWGFVDVIETFVVVEHRPAK